MLNKLRKGLLASVIGIGFMASTSHAALEMPNPAYTRLVIFGDSLSDSGNNSLVFGNNAAQSISGNGYIPGQTYASGTYSNGPVWATHQLSAGLQKSTGKSVRSDTPFRRPCEFPSLAGARRHRQP